MNQNTTQKTSYDNGNKTWMGTMAETTCPTSNNSWTTGKQFDVDANNKANKARTATTKQKLTHAQSTTGGQ
jgi:hypothetical protein